MLKILLVMVIGITIYLKVPIETGSGFRKANVSKIRCEKILYNADGSYSKAFEKGIKAKNTDMGMEVFIPYSNITAIVED